MKPRAKRSLHAQYTPAGADGIGRLELTRPEKLNATDDDSVGDLDRAANLAANVRAASVATKRLTARSYDLPFSRILPEYVRAQRVCWNDGETKENLARYRAGRWRK